MSSEKNHAAAKNVIRDYLRASGLQIRRGTLEYRAFIRNVLWGLHPGLSGHKERDAILTFAANYADESSRRPPLVRHPSSPRTQARKTPLLATGYDRQAAVNYAHSWALGGGKKRSRLYPDFDFEDCTNFVSQAVFNGGVNMRGSGSCKQESTVVEWYVTSAMGVLCFADFAWSTSWSVVVDFFRYHVENAPNARLAVYTPDQISGLRGDAEVGDVVQLQQASGGPKWHSMLLTRKSGKELYFTYHAGPDGLDVVDNPLSEILSRTAPLRYWLEKFT